jgi:hypothetical protein
LTIIHSLACLAWDKAQPVYSFLVISLWPTSNFSVYLATLAR